MSGAPNVGILAMECYFPKRVVPQTALEEQDGCSGKYVTGLGQTSLAFFDDREDVASIMLTALSRLLENFGVKPEEVGRLEVGTETLVDKSKSVKTTLLAEIFGENADVEGVTSTNACYGGTAALFNSAAWVESSVWDGRYAVVVCGDIAVYAPGPARPTGGGGAVAMLIGADAPLALRGPRATHAVEVYDFYKPRGDTEYATVDGKLSQNAYLTAVDKCWALLKAKRAKLQQGAPPLTIDAFGYACLHSPYNKLVEKGFARLVLGDFLAAPETAEFAAAEGAQKYKGAEPAALLTDREAEGVFRALSASRFKAKCGPSDTISRQVGNCYTGALYMNLLSLVSNVGAGLEGHEVLMFSYGSGAVATAFTLQGRVPTGAYEGGNRERFTLASIGAAADVVARLAARTTTDIGVFNAAMDLRASRYGTAGYEPTGATSELFAGSYYLKKVDELYRRSYARA